MRLGFNFHTAKESASSSKIFQYLEKENAGQIISNQHKILDGKEVDEEHEKVEYFFNQDFDPSNLNDPNSKINVYDATMAIDNNRGSKSLKESNFYMLNISPSNKELKHIENLAVKELESRGLFFEQLQDNSILVPFYEEQKENLIKLQLKLYTEKCMDEYARLMDREIYSNQNALPDLVKRKELKPEIEKRFTDFLNEKGINFREDIVEPNYVSLEKYTIKQEYEHGSLINFYAEDIDKKIDLFIPKNKLKIESEVIQIEEEYFSEKYSIIREKEESKNQLIEIEAASTNQSSDYFQDYFQENKIVIDYHFEKFDKNLKLYFSESELEIVGGECIIPNVVYNEKLYEVKSQFLAKEFSSIREELFNSEALSKGFNLSKATDEKGKEFFLFKDKLPNKEEAKKLNISTSVLFNKFLVKENYLEERQGFKISNWNDKQIIDATILATSEKAQLLQINDKRFIEPVQFWVANYALSDDRTDDKIEIISEFYEHKINEIRLREHGEKTNYVDFQIISNDKEKLIKNEDSIQFSFNDSGLKEQLKFNIKIEDLYVSENGNFSMRNEDFQHKYNTHLIEQSKLEFSKEYEKIKKQVNEQNIEAKDFIKNREIEKQYKAFLVDKNILKGEPNDNFLLKSEIVEKKKNSVLVSFKNENEDVRFWVNEKLITGKHDNGLYFRNEKEISSLLNKALDRDKERKIIKEIDFDKVESELKSIKNETGEKVEQKIFTFYKNENGLDEPIKFKIPESELIIENDKFFIEKYKLDYKVNNAIKYGISKEYGNVKDKIKNEVWKENGFDVSKRKITGKDLLYFGKIEKERTYKHDNKAVLYNRPILQEIELLKNGQQTKYTQTKIDELTKSLERDRYTREIIKEGVKKGGLNYHSHVIISRHDKTSIYAEDKVSMSPNANQKDGIMYDGSKVGFERSKFFENAEQIFDKSFEYDRAIEEHYKYKNTLSKLKGNVASKATAKVQGLLVAKIKQEIKEKLGLKEITNHSAIGINIPTSIPKSPTDVLNLVNISKIKNQISEIPIPTSLPRGKIDLVIKTIKLVKNLVVDKGMQI